jgi:hypothetical protein
LPDNTVIEAIEFSQPADSCHESDDDQRLRVDFFDAGGGYYFTFATERWAVDAYDKLLQSLVAVMEYNDVAAGIVPSAEPGE